MIFNIFTSSLVHIGHGGNILFAFCKILTVLESFMVKFDILKMPSILPFHQPNFPNFAVPDKNKTFLVSLKTKFPFNMVSLKTEMPSILIFLSVPLHLSTNNSRGRQLMYLEIYSICLLIIVLVPRPEI